MANRLLWVVIRFHFGTQLCIILLFVPVLLVSGLHKEDCGSGGEMNFRQPRNISSNQSGRIVNGKVSQRGAWPWQISLQLLHPKFGFLGHWCGGALIDPWWILTAAHCVHNDIFNLPIAVLWTAVLGDWDQNVEEKTEMRIPIEKVYLHDHFHHYQNDIALFKLSRKAKLDNNAINTICLPESEMPLESGKKSCIATGWGRATVNGTLAAKLLEARIPLHNISLCKQKYSRQPGGVPIKGGHLCAGQLDGSTGTCVGDSGGPLQCSKQDGSWYLAGITSFGSGCAKPGFPDVYTRVSFYLPWIYDKMNSTEQFE